jgi:hypothetical protein
MEKSRGAVDPVDQMSQALNRQHVAEQKIAAGNPHSGNIPFRSTREMADAFKAIREKVGEIAWLGELERYGWRSLTLNDSATTQRSSMNRPN